MNYPHNTPDTLAFFWLKTSLFFGLLIGAFYNHPLQAASGEVVITLFRVQMLNKKANIYKVQANIKYQLTDYLHQALLNGITLKADLQFYHNQPRSWMWDQETHLNDLKFQIKYHPLSRHYLLSRNDTNEHWNFRNLPAVLRQMGEIRNFVLPPIPPKIPDEPREIYAIAHLNASNLDLPLRLQSFISDDYSLTSEEARWPLP
ncbi:MAG: DUF4390 domain-containing protein [Cocleimonas sp.]|nr:DUF4390 domain-containing protein [Cocleimonas sp.]